MTEDELTIETLRYRAPIVIPLKGGRFAVLTPGWKTPVQVVAPGMLEAVLYNYIEWNQLPAAKPPKGVRVVPLDDVALLHDTLEKLLGE